MGSQHSERRLILERRLVPVRRRGLERRIAERRQVRTPVLTEQRFRADQRQGIERRSFVERRGGIERRGTAETVDEHIRNALQLLANVSQYGVLPDEERRDLDAAVRRLTIALRQLQRGPARRSQPDPRLV